jgi:hypothetical protein
VACIVQVAAMDCRFRRQSALFLCAKADLVNSPLQPSWLLHLRSNIVVDTYSLLMVSIFQKAYPLSPKPRAEIFLQHFASEIDRTLFAQKLLGLVEKAPSNIGFKPTSRLIGIITDRMVQSTVENESTAVKVDDDFLKLFWKLVAGNDCEDDSDDDGDEQEDEDGEGGEDGQTFCWQVFVVLGLLRENADRYVPTRLMHNCCEKTQMATYRMASCT